MLTILSKTDSDNSDTKNSVGGNQLVNNMGEKPTVSVIITTYYRNKGARMAVESVLNQTYDNIETILVDGSGERHASTLADEYPDIKYIPQDENKGLIADRNLGYKLATGEFIHFLDDDDRLRPSKIQKQIDIINDDPDIGVVYTGLYRERDDKELIPGRKYPSDFLEIVLKQQQPPCYPSNMLIDREVLGEVMPLDPYWDGADDIVLELQLAQRTNFAAVNEPLLIRGEEDESMAITQKAVETRRQVLHEFQHLYEGYPDSVRKVALAGTYNAEGQVKLKDSRWSSRAIIAFSKAAYYYPGIRIDFLGSFVMSCFGRHTWILGRKGLIIIKKIAGRLL